FWSITQTRMQGDSITMSADCRLPLAVFTWDNGWSDASRILTRCRAFGLWTALQICCRRGLPVKEDTGMASMDERKDAFEKKFAHDEELKFKAVARRNKLLGLWAAEKLGKTGEAAEAYAKEVIMADFQEIGDDDVFRKIRADFDAAGVEQSDHQIRRTMEELMAQAIESARNA